VKVRASGRFKWNGKVQHPGLPAFDMPEADARDHACMGLVTIVRETATREVKPVKLTSKRKTDPNPPEGKYLRRDVIPPKSR